MRFISSVARAPAPFSFVSGSHSAQLLRFYLHILCIHYGSHLRAWIWAILCEGKEKFRFRLWHSCTRQRIRIGGWMAKVGRICATWPALCIPPGICLCAFNSIQIKCLERFGLVIRALLRALLGVCVVKLVEHWHGMLAKMRKENLPGDWQTKAPSSHNQSHKGHVLFCGHGSDQLTNW